MAQVVVLDTGPLVAFLDRREREHARVAETMKSLTAPLLTVEPVLAEACFLLRRVSGGTQAILRMIRDGLLVVPLRVSEEAAALDALMGKYADVPMSLTDACLVRVVELNPRALVFTLASDFRVYRTHRRRVIRLVA